MPFDRHELNPNAEEVEECGDPVTSLPSVPESLLGEPGPQVAFRRSALFGSFEERSDANHSASDALQPSDVFARIVSNTVLSQASVRIPSMPWETRPTRAIFCNTDFDDSNLQAPLANAFRDDCPHENQVKDFPEILSDVASKLVVEKSLSCQAISNLADKDFYTRQAELRSLAVDKWLCIVRSYTLSSQVGQLILSQCNLDKIDEAREIISSVIGTKSSTTAISRANSVLKYLRWVNDRGEVLDPQAEATAWEYVKHLKSSGAAATVGSTWLSVSLRFWVPAHGSDCQES